MDVASCFLKDGLRSGPGRVSASRGLLVQLSAPRATTDPESWFTFESSATGGAGCPYDFDFDER